MSTVNFCRECGTPIDDDVVFCHDCYFSFKLDHDLSPEQCEEDKEYDERNHSIIEEE